MRSGDYGLFGQFADRVNESRTGLLRGRFTFRRPEHGVPLEEVESVESLVQHFKTGAMSYGSISQEAHEALAVAMNRLHGKSNSGEAAKATSAWQAPARPTTAAAPSSRWPAGGSA